MDKIKFAIIGCGYIGKRHAEIVFSHPEAQLMALCDILPKEKLGTEKFTVPFFSSIDNLLKQNIEIDVINICTPNGLHALHTIKSLKAGKHVICEKPMALSKVDCEAMVHASAQSQKNIFIVKQNRYSPPSVWLKDLIDNKNLGEIFLVQLNCYWNRDERYYIHSSAKDTTAGWRGTQNLDGGTLFTQFSHWIDLLYWIFGDITEIQAKFADFNHSSLTEFEDSGIVNFRFVNGGIGSVNYSTSVWDKNLESSITIIGSKGSVKIGGQYMDKVEYCHVRNYKMPVLLPTPPVNDYGGYKGSANNHPIMIQNVIDILKGKTTIPHVNATEGMKVVDIIERIYSLRKSNKKS